ncbi:hypothetical protein BH11GEM2_BH11GEM2_06970 [soil metagenome]
MFGGLNTTGGTEGVGQSTTRAVVLSSMLILITYHFLTQILFGLFAPLASHDVTTARDIR